jgi:hypothetical protein
MPSTSTFNKVTKVAFKGMSLLKNSLAFGKYYDDQYSGEYAQRQAIGSTLIVPLSQRYIAQRNDMTFNQQAFDRPTTTLVVDQTATIPLAWESIEKALDMERGEENVEKTYIQPAIAYIRQAIESDLAQFAAQNSNMVVGALGTNPSTYDGTSAAALQALGEMGCPVDDENLGLFVPFAVNRSVKTGAISLPSAVQATTKQFRTGYVDHTDGFDWYRSNSLYTHTTGVWATLASVTVAGAGQSGSSLNINCTTGDTFKKGDKISIASVNSVNLMTRSTTSTSAAGTKTFTILADTVGAANVATLSIYPPIYGPGSHYQNVDALPGNTAVLTLWPGTTIVAGAAKTGKVAVALYPGAFLIAGVPLEEPEGSVEFCKQVSDPTTGVSIRIIRQWDNKESRMTTRLDAQWGRGIGLAEQGSVAIACA